MAIIDDKALDQLFRAARSQNGWTDAPVSNAQLHALYDLMKWGPTTSNSQPQRILFLRSTEAKERLRPALTPGNVDKTLNAPVVAVLAYDLKFYENIANQFPKNPRAGEHYANDPANAETTAFRNATLQGAYFMLAARALGFDCGPMSGFKNEMVDAAFFPDGRWKSNFICGIGSGDPSKVPPRYPRLSFDQACKIL